MAEARSGLPEPAAETGSFGRGRLADLGAKFLGLVFRPPSLCRFCPGRKPLHFLADLTGFRDQFFLTRQTAVETHERGIVPLRFSGDAASEAEVNDCHDTGRGQKSCETCLQPSVQREGGPAQFLGGGDSLKRGA